MKGVVNIVFGWQGFGVGGEQADHTPAAIVELWWAVRGGANTDKHMEEKKRTEGVCWRASVRSQAVAMGGMGNILEEVNTPATNHKQPSEIGKKQKT